MLRHRELFSTCARLSLVGILASCASLDDADTGFPDTDFTTSDVSQAAGDHPTFAVTEEGIVRGITTATTREFRGIPYAAAPVGDLRWRAPQRHAPWHGVLDTTQFANHCPQVAGAFGRASTTEDCLFLNVFTPRHPAARRPVMVWIHGGALVTGESDDYDATRLVEQGDVIVVTINYRLGTLGFLAHPALTGESPDHVSGNYGLLDQQEALRWVRRNILRFGGDPSNVTIFGEAIRSGALGVEQGRAIRWRIEDRGLA